MRAADRSRIRTFGRAFGPIEWHDDPLDLIFDEETSEIQPPLDHVNDAWRGYRPAFGQRMPTKAQWRWWPLRILSDESLRVTTVHTFGCPYGATECPAPALPAGLPGSRTPAPDGTTLVRVDDVPSLTRVLAAVPAAGGEVLSVWPRRETLEDLFLREIGRAKAEEAAS